MPNKYYSDPVFHIRWITKNIRCKLGTISDGFCPSSVSNPSHRSISTLIPLDPPIHFWMMVIIIPGNGEIRSET